MMFFFPRVISQCDALFDYDHSLFGQEWLQTVQKLDDIVLFEETHAPGSGLDEGERGRRRDVKVVAERRYDQAQGRRSEDGWNAVHGARW